MKTIYSDFIRLSRGNQYLTGLLLVISVLFKIFFFYYQRNISGPDSSEYLYLSNLLAEKGLVHYITSSNPFTFWRLPSLPLFIYFTHSIDLFYVLQLLLTYFLAYNFYQIIKLITSDYKISIICFFAILFLPYINIAACAPLTEFLQISFIIYSFRKVLYKEYDFFLLLSLVLFCFLRAEAQYFIYFLMLRELVKKQYRNTLFYTVPLLLVLIWCVRNKHIFDSFSLVNPVLSSRAMIGSLYGVIYEKNENSFHKKFNYYEARDYLHNKKFVDEYKKAVGNEIRNKILNDPIGYVMIRLKQFSKAFLYLMFNMEQLPDDNWRFKKHTNLNDLLAVNSKWAYSEILKNKDYGKLSVRLLYNGGLAFIHFFGLLFIFFNYRRLLPLMFVLLNFSFVAIVEIDMRYLITIQSVCVCAFILMSYSLLKYRTLRLNWIPPEK